MLLHHLEKELIKSIITRNTIISSGFMEDNPSGQLSKMKMMEMYNGVLSVSKATKFVEEIFIKFDRDNNGHIDFKVVFHIQYDIKLQYAHTSYIQGRQAWYLQNILVRIYQYLQIFKIISILAGVAEEAV